MNNNVYLKYLDSYDIEIVRRVVRESFASMNIEKIVHPKMKILIKICMPCKTTPDTGICTHPAVVRGVIDVLNEFGVDCIVADSPYGKLSNNILDSIYMNTGMLEVANTTKCTLNNDLKSCIVETTDGVKAKSIKMLDVINEVDAIINIGKFHIDKRLGYVGACANMFGLLPGEVKTLVMNTLNTVADFNDYVIDIIDSLSDKLVLNVVDGVVSLEAGDSPRMLSCLAVSENIFSLDASLIDILGLKYQHTILEQAEARQKIDLDDPYNILGDELEKFKVEDFALFDITNSQLLNTSKSKQNSYFKRHQKRVVIKPNKCKGCGVCSKICPTGAIMMKYDKEGELYAYVDYKKCIFCNKCYLECPYKVVGIKTPMGYKILDKNINKYNKDAKK